MKLIKQDKQLNWNEEITIKIPLGQFIQIVMGYGDSCRETRERLYKSTFNLSINDISEIESFHTWKDTWKDIIKILEFYGIEWEEKKEGE